MMAVLPVYSHLTSDTLDLCSDTPTQHFKIHKALLRARCNPQSLPQSFKHTETKTGGIRAEPQTTECIVFQNTAPEIVVRFIEWAYTDTYSDHIHINPVGPHSQPSTPGVKEPCTPAITETPVHLDPKETTACPVTLAHQRSSPSLDSDTTMHTLAADANHPVLCHAHMYRLATLYGIQELRILACEKLWAKLATLDPKDPTDKQVVIALLGLGFSILGLGDDDPLVRRLELYTAHHLVHLIDNDAFYCFARKKLPGILKYQSWSFIMPWNSESWRVSLKIDERREGVSEWGNGEGDGGRDTVMEEGQSERRSSGGEDAVEGQSGEVCAEPVALSEDELSGIDEDRVPEVDNASFKADDEEAVDACEEQPVPCEDEPPGCYEIEPRKVDFAGEATESSSPLEPEPETEPELATELELKHEAIFQPIFQSIPNPLNEEAFNTAEKDNDNGDQPALGSPKTEITGKKKKKKMKMKMTMKERRRKEREEMEKEEKMNETGFNLEVSDNDRAVVDGGGFSLTG